MKFKNDQIKGTAMGTIFPPTYQCDILKSNFIASALLPMNKF